MTENLTSREFAYMMSGMAQKNNKNNQYLFMILMGFAAVAVVISLVNVQRRANAMRYLIIENNELRKKNQQV